MNPHSRILYVQYTDPGGYPPLEHSSRILADRGWNVLFLGTRVRTNKLQFRSHPRIASRFMDFEPGGWRQKKHYLEFSAWVLRTARAWHPDWVYASDVLSAPCALAAQWVSGARAIYHEHDAPAPPRNGWMRLNLYCRQVLAKRAVLCIVPNQQRAADFARTVGVRAECVWNCPTRDEVASPDPVRPDDSLRLVYQGSLVPPRLPLTLVHALAQLPARVKLRVIGYETIGYIGYKNEFLDEAARLDVRERVEVMDAVPRAELLALCRACDVGLTVLPLASSDRNEQTMVGASNKPFDYLACGLPLIVSDFPDWRDLYVANGFGRACDPQDVSSIVTAVQWYLEHPNERRAMGVQGRTKIQSEWNYETQFEKVYEELCR